MAFGFTGAYNPSIDPQMQQGIFSPQHVGAAAYRMPFNDMSFGRTMPPSQVMSGGFGFQQHQMQGMQGYAPPAQNTGAFGAAIQQILSFAQIMAPNAVPTLGSFSPNADVAGQLLGTGTRNYFGMAAGTRIPGNLDSHRAVNISRIGEENRTRRLDELRANEEYSALSELELERILTRETTQSRLAAQMERGFVNMRRVELGRDLSDEELEAVRRDARNTAVSVSSILDNPDMGGPGDPTGGMGSAIFRQMVYPLLQAIGIQDDIFPMIGAAQGVTRAASMFSENLLPGGMNPIAGMEVSSFIAERFASASDRRGFSMSDMGDILGIIGARDGDVRSFLSEGVAADGSSGGLTDSEVSRIADRMENWRDTMDALRRLFGTPDASVNQLVRALRQTTGASMDQVSEAELRSMVSRVEGSALAAGISGAEMMQRIGIEIQQRRALGMRDDATAMDRVTMAQTIAASAFRSGGLDAIGYSQDQFTELAGNILRGVDQAGGVAAAGTFRRAIESLEALAGIETDDDMSVLERYERLYGNRGEDMPDSVRNVLRYMDESTRDSMSENERRRAVEAINNPHELALALDRLSPGGRWGDELYDPSERTRQMGAQDESLISSLLSDSVTAEISRRIGDIGGDFGSGDEARAARFRAINAAMDAYAANEGDGGAIRAIREALDGYGVSPEDVAALAAGIRSAGEAMAGGQGIETVAAVIAGAREADADLLIQETLGEFKNEIAGKLGDESFQTVAARLFNSFMAADEADREEVLRSLLGGVAFTPEVAARFGAVEEAGAALAQARRDGADMSQLRELQTEFLDAVKAFEFTDEEKEALEARAASMEDDEGGIILEGRDSEFVGPTRPDSDDDDRLHDGGGDDESGDGDDGASGGENITVVLDCPVTFNVETSDPAGTFALALNGHAQSENATT